MHSPGGYFYSGVGGVVEPKGYFDAMYFPPAGASVAAAALASSGGVAAEIMKDASQQRNVVAKEKVENGDGGIQLEASSSSPSTSLSRDKSPQSASSSMAETNATGASWFTQSESGDQDEDREEDVGSAERDRVNKTHSLNASTNSLGGFAKDGDVVLRSHSMSGKRECGPRHRGRPSGEVVPVQVDPPQGVHRSESDPHGRLVEQALHAIV